jgi:hypothetical protein
LKCFVCVINISRKNIHQHRESDVPKGDNGSQRGTNEAKLTDVGQGGGKWRTLRVRIWEDAADWTEDSKWFLLLIIKKKRK